MLNEPNLFNLITSGIEGKIIEALRFSLYGVTASTTFCAKSSINIREATKISALAISTLKSSKFLSFLSSSIRYPLRSIPIGPLISFIDFAASVKEF